MSLPAGTRLGSYVIKAELGAGGMGEVYRAADTKLGREVAIKVLPPGVARSAESLARFAREARLLAALNHPSIAAIHDFDEADDTLFLVLELVEGEDLAERLKRGALPLEEACDIARQIASALEEAHEKGIVHRDLKPANVKLTADGKVKVLDFGLAKAYSSQALGGGSLPTESSETTLDTTMEGMILGTTAYMSPEQARAKPVDKRTDIWALGVLLYEMLAGEQLFHGPTASDTLAAVLTRELDMTGLPADTPAAIRRLLRRCLERNPKDRLHDVADARIVLDDVLRGATDEPAPMLGPRKRAFLGVPLVAWFVVIAALAAGAGWMLRRPAIAERPAEGRWALALPHGVTLSATELPKLALSRDATTQVVSVLNAKSTPQLLVRRSDEFEARLLPGTERATAPFLAPDGAWIGFFRDGAVHKMSVEGGPSVRLAPASGQPRGATWSQDGFIYFAIDNNVALSRVSENGGEVMPVTHLDPARAERTHRWPHALPDGDAVLFTSDTQNSTEYYDDARIEAVRPATGERKVLVEGARQAWFSPNGHLLFARGGSLFAIRFEASALEVRGGPMPVAERIATDDGSGVVQFALAPGGAALWAPAETTEMARLVVVDRGGSETPVPIPSGPYNEIALAPDGKQLALVGTHDGVSDLWVADLERGALTRLTTGDFIRNPVWTPDGSRLAYSRFVQGRQDNLSQVAWKPADGSREAEILVEGPRGYAPTCFSPDGRLLIYAASAPDAAADRLWELPLDAPRTPRVLLAGAFRVSEGVLSPDGRWLAYVSDEGGQNSVYVRPFSRGEGRWQISTALGLEPRWSHDGRELYYRAGGELYRTPIDTTRGFSAGRPERVCDDVSTEVDVYTYSPAPDGKGIFALRTATGGANVRTLHLDLGFTARVAHLLKEGTGR